MSAARRELGEDAILIQTKRLDPQEDGIKYEVTFGIGGEVGSTAVAAPAIAFSPTPRANQVKDSEDTVWAEELRRLRAEIVTLHEIVSRNYWEPEPPVVQYQRTVRLQNQLTQHGVDTDLAAEWLTALEDSLKLSDPVGDGDATAVMLTDVLSSRIRADSSLGWDGSHGKAIMLVGPAGAGKTTALLKLALEFGIKRARSVYLWSLAPRSVELDQTTEAFAHLLNISTRTFKSPQGLVVELGKVNLDDHLVLIDTKGFGMDSVDTDQELSMALRVPAPIDCLLVLPAVWQPSALSRAVDRYEVFQPARLLFTMLDQTGALGAILQESWRTRKPLSFLSEGGFGSGRIRPASLDSILESIDQVTGQ
jgi:flagellar biosynthesis protein FlhF